MKQRQLSSQLSSIKSFTPELKSEILSKVIIPGAVISQIAKSYNLSPKNLYNWRNHHLKNPTIQRKFPIYQKSMIHPQQNLQKQNLQIIL